MTDDKTVIPMNAYSSTAPDKMTRQGMTLDAKALRRARADHARALAEAGVSEDDLRVLRELAEINAATRPEETDHLGRIYL